VARAETHATLWRFLERMADIRIRRPTTARRCTAYDYDRTYMLRGLTTHLEFTPAD